MLGTAAALALIWAMAFPAAGDPVSYEAAVAAGLGAESTPANDEGSDSGASVLSPEQQALMAADPRWTARVNLYHAGGGGAIAAHPGHDRRWRRRRADHRSRRRLRRSCADG